MSTDVMLEAFRFCMKEEGGATYTNDPRDPGGPTKYGIALRYNRDAIPDKNMDGVIDAKDVQLLEERDALDLYCDRYWKPNGCDTYPAPLAFLYADMVFNPGPGVTPKLLQKALNTLGHTLKVDGQVGRLTRAAIENADMKDLIVALSNERLSYYKSRSGWKHYGRGWTNRTNRCRDAALALLEA